MHPRNPIPTVDVIIEYAGGVVFVERKNPPFGWALPGGFVEYGESLETAAKREAAEETGLELSGLAQFRAYSEPDRDPRQHTVTMVFTARGQGVLRAASDAARALAASPENPPGPLAFDHARIIEDYLAARRGK